MHALETCLRRLLFLATLAVAGLLAMTVLLAPLVDPVLIPEPWASRLLQIFASDAMVRRTAVVSAVGLMVTACVFFRTRSGPSDRKKSSSTLTTPGNFAGA